MLACNCQLMNPTLLITGAAVRLGALMARSLAQSGWHVIIHAHRSLKEAKLLCDQLRSEGLQASCVIGDLTTAQGPEAVFQSALDCAETITALINNAAVFERQTLTTATAADFENMWRINTLAPIRLTQLLAAHVQTRNTCGCVVNLLDQRITQIGSDALPYLLSKKTLADFTLTAALALAPSLRVNAVAPGAVLLATQTKAQEPAGYFPLNKRPLAQHVLEAVRYLLDAPGITGQIIYVDSGQHLAGTKPS